MIAVDEMTLENGCLSIAENYEDIAMANPTVVRERVNSNPLYDFFEDGDRNGDIQYEALCELSWRAPPLPAVVVAIFDSFMLHSPGPSVSALARRAIFVTFNLATEGMWYGAYYRHKRAEPRAAMFRVSARTAHR